MEGIMANKNALARLMLSENPDAIITHANATRIAEETYANQIVNTTKEVNEKKMRRMIKKFEDVCDEVVKLDIVPIGFKIHCHQNCKYYCNIDNNFETRLGYNITSCGNGNAISLEIHTVLYHKITNTFYDITPDFLHEKSKWFLPFKNRNMSYNAMIRMVGRRFDFCSIRCGRLVDEFGNEIELDCPAGSISDSNDVLKFLEQTKHTRFHFM